MVDIPSLSNLPQSITEASKEQLLQHLKGTTSEAILRKIKDKVDASDFGKQQIKKRQQPTQTDTSSQLLTVNQIEQERLFRIRKEFQTSLNKLNSNETKMIGMRECEQVIKENNDPSSLRIYLSLLCEKHKNSTTSNKEMQVRLFGHLATVYKGQMLDPLDKPPNLMKTVVRVCESIHSYMKEPSPSVHQAIASALIEILENCFSNKEDKLSLSLIFYEPMAVVINGGLDQIGQLAAATCISHLLDYLIQKGHGQLFDFIVPKLVTLYHKCKCENEELTLCL